MKKVILSALLLAGACATMSSCNNGDYNATPSGGVNWNPGSGSSGGGNNGGINYGTMSAKINGTQWTATSTIVSTQIGFQVIGQDNSGKGIAVQMTSYNGPGTYTIGFSNTGNVSAVSVIDPNSAMEMLLSGSVVITSDQNNSVAGTFSATGTNFTVTEGKFNVHK